MIFVHEKNNIFHLQSEKLSYLMQVVPSGHLSLLHFGKKIRDHAGLNELFQNFTVVPGNSTQYWEDMDVSLDTLRLELPTYGKGDYRESSMNLQFPDGSRVTDFLYERYEIHDNKISPTGLPRTFDCNEKTQTLEIVLKEKVLDVRVHLFYTLFKEANVLVKSLKVSNQTEDTIVLDKIMSGNLDLPDANWQMMTLDGKWIKERQIHEGAIRPGVYYVDSKKGVSGSTHSPYIGLRRKETTEHVGACYGMALMYSGNHKGLLEVSPYGMTRIQMGINDFDFSWQLGAQEVFETPEMLLTYSDAGLNGMSQQFHQMVENHIVPQQWQKKERPILINNWEATYFDFNEHKLLQLAKRGKKIGIELFVLDDGWFTNRSNDSDGLGDWEEDFKKLPGGLAGLSQKIKNMGLQFGLWVEPEMVSTGTKLYKEHPDWVIQLPNRTPSFGRHQLMLDLSNPAVVEDLEQKLVRVFETAQVDYVKWDMNRNISDLYSAHLSAVQQKELAHRYTLGLYALLKRLTERFPNILFESCSSGGNRFDLGMLYYMPQTWTSDDTDACERYEIQYGTSMVFPPSTMGAHVSGRPSHQVLRSTPIETRFNVAAFGLLGYELDLTRLSAFDLKVMKQQIEYYKVHRALLQFGSFSRMESPVNNNRVTWMVGSGDEFLIGDYQKLQQASPNLEKLFPVGLQEDTFYQISSRKQYHNVRDFGELINAFIPVKIQDGGVAQAVISKHYLYAAEVQTFEGYGDAWMAAGMPLYPQFVGTGMNERTRHMGDFGSRLYYGCKVESKE